MSQLHEVPRPFDGLNDIPNFTLGDRMRRALRHSGIAAMDMAVDLDVNPTTVSRWISDKTPVGRSHLRIWAMTTGVSLHWLETGCETPACNLRACRDSNPKPSDWESGDARCTRCGGYLWIGSRYCPNCGRDSDRAVVVDLAAYRAARGKDDDWSECPECGQVVWHGSDCTCGRRWDADRAGVAS